MVTYLAIDVGATTLKYALVTQAGEIVVKGDQQTPTRDVSSFVSCLEALILRHQDDIQGVGLALPGIVSPSAGRVIASPGLPFLAGIPLARRLAHRVRPHLPISIEGEANAAALAEKWQGHLATVANGALLDLDTGIAAAVFLNGRLFRGAHFAGVEPGLMVIDATNPDVDGQTAAGLSAVGLVASIAEKLDLHEPQLEAQVFSAIARGVPEARLAFAAFSRAVAILIYNLQAILDLERVVIGGELSAQPLVAAQLSQAVTTLQQEAPLAAQRIHVPQIVAAQFRADASVIGAVYPLVKH